MPHHVALSHGTEPNDHPITNGVLEGKRTDQRLDVVRHLRHGPPGRVAGVRAAVCRGGRGRARDTPASTTRIEGREPDRAVEPRPAVEGDERPPLPPLVDVELHVADGNAHQNAASRTPVAISSRMNAATHEPVDDEDRVVVAAHVAEQPADREQAAAGRRDRADDERPHPSRRADRP